MSNKGVTLHDLDDDTDRFYPVGTTVFDNEWDKMVVKLVYDTNDIITMGHTIATFGEQA